jgi:hypothetical protein
MDLGGGRKKGIRWEGKSLKDTKTAEYSLSSRDAKYLTSTVEKLCTELI